MATRPVFVPDTDPENPQLVHEHEVDFQWVSDRSADQKKENIAKLHIAAGRRNLDRLLEVAPVSNDPLGRQICPSNLAVEDEKSYLIPMMAAYHGSKVFSGGGPFMDLYVEPADVIDRDERLKLSGNLRGFRFSGLEWGFQSDILFYDWLTLHAIQRYQKLRSGIRRFRGFTEIGCHMGEKSICHARSCAFFVALAEKNLLDEVLASQDRFIATLLQDPFYQLPDRSPL